jgi:nitrate reductase beta subunit
VAACPSGAIYKRGEDGIVLVNQDKCRGWRMCVTACPYKKTYYNWNTGKSEKCILCFPRMETGHVPACMHTCVGRIRYLGVLLYDADLIKTVAVSDDADLVKNQMEIYLDPNDPKIIKAAKENGIADDTLEAAQKSPVYKFVKEWGLALPLHPEYRTVPNLFYVPPLLPTMGKVEDGNYHNSAEELFGGIENTRLPLSYMAGLFSAGNTETIKTVLKKLMAVRWYRRDVTVGDQSKSQLEETLKQVGVDRKTADDIYRLTSLPTVNDRYVIPPAHREEALEMIEDAGDVKGNTGFGFHHKPTRGL